MNEDFEIAEPGLDYSDPRDAPPDPENLLAATDPDHVFGPDGFCRCRVHRSRGWVPCSPATEAEARIQWNEIIGACWRPRGNTAPIPWEPAPPRTRAKPKRSPPQNPERSPGLWDESEIIP